MSLYKRQKLTRMAQLFSSTNPGVCQAAHLLLTEKRKKSRVKFKPAVLVDEIRAQDPSRKRQALAAAAKSFLAEEDADGRHEHLCSLHTQGQMAWCWEGNSPELWVRAVEGLSPEPMKFAINAVLDTLPMNSNLRRWSKKPHETCPLCSSHQSLCHILNNCPTALKLHRYSRRHDEVLQLLGELSNLSSTHLFPSPLIYQLQPIASPSTLPPETCVLTLSGGLTIERSCGCWS